MTYLIMKLKKAPSFIG